MPEIKNNHGIKAELRRIDGKLELGIRNDGDSNCEHWIWYPVKELPPHGDLIDKDAFIQWLELQDKLWERTYTVPQLKEMLRKGLPVIVPRSE